MVLTPKERRLVDYAKPAIVAYNQMRHQRGGMDTLYSFLMSDSGKIYEGLCFEPNIAQATVCGERHAIQNMVLKESYKAKIETILVADPVPEVQKNNTPPCGTCRHLIWQFGKPDATVILMQYIQRKRGWVFPKLVKYSIKELYPHPYEPVEDLWDGWEPK